MNKKIILVSALSFGYFAEAQQSQFFHNSPQYHYDLAEHLYQTKIYNAAQYEYAKQYFYNEQLSRSKKEAAQFFDNVIGVILQKKYAEKGLDSFIKEYPNSSFFAQANLPLSDYYLAQKDFDKALETLKKINQYQLSKEENTEYIMKLGYAKFMTGDTQGAIEALTDAYQNANGQSKNDIAYMLGHLHYVDNNQNKAFGYFDEIRNDEKYAQIVHPYYVQMYYNNKQYDQAISEGNALINKGVSSSYKNEIHKIIGESYFMKGDYSSAYPHLKIYLENQQNPSESDLYQMGFVAAQLNKYDEAVSYYNQLINSQSALAQNAYYQLGNAYLLTDKKQEALSAFRSAYHMSYDTDIQQLAHEQYAKLSYDIGNPFEATPTVIQSYINNYPKAEKSNEMKSLLIKSYLYSGNYKETLNAIDRLPDSSQEIDKIDQEVSYLLGTEEFNKGNFDEA
ncbi:MAG: tetratricopeptide repeat protein [Bergeyella zoohelcum]|nr:tetratricopeptide repeat protein [Bergeyella zoohelcum]